MYYRLFFNRSTTDFSQESIAAGMRVASHVTSKAATDVAGSLSDHFAPQVNITAVQMQPERIAIISQTADRPVRLLLNRPVGHPNYRPRYV